MSGILGVSVGARAVVAVLLRKDHICWAGRAEYGGVADLADVIARLAGEAPRGVRRARVVLERDLVQLRTLVPAPPIGPRAAARYVALEAPRLFRRNGVALATDAAVLPVDGGLALWAGAAPEPHLQAIASGLEQAGIRLDAMGPSADVLPESLGARVRGEVCVANGATTEVLTVARCGVWRSRRVRGARRSAIGWAKPLRHVGDEASTLAAAFAAAVARPRLSLLPVGARLARERAARRRLVRVLLLGAVAWCTAGAFHTAKLVHAVREADRGLARLGPALDRALAVRRDLALAQDALATIAAAETERSRTLLLLADLTAALGDSAFLVSLRLAEDGTLRLAGYAAQAPRVLAELERVPWLREAAFDGPAARELLGEGADRREWDRFSLVAGVEPAP